MHVILLGLGGPELLIILGAVLLLFGAKKIPEIARMMGKGMKEFRRATEDIKKELNESAADLSEDFRDIKRDLEETKSIVKDNAKDISRNLEK